MWVNKLMWKWCLIKFSSFFNKIKDERGERIKYKLLDIVENIILNGLIFNI